MKSEVFHKVDIILPPVKDTKKIMIGTCSSPFAAKQIIINFSGKSDMTITPHHIRPPRQKNESELRYSTRSRYSTLDHEKGKQIKLFDPPLNLEKDYLTIIMMIY